MTTVFQPAGPLGQLCNLSFLLAALVSDVLLIRLFLCLAYVFLLTSAALGSPRWPTVDATGTVHVDGLVWSSLCLLFHGVSLFRLLWDERRITFRDEDEEQLWRMFYRRRRAPLRRMCGMRRLEMKETLRFGGWQRVPAGKPIMPGNEVHTRFFVLVEGLASLRHVVDGVEAEPYLQFSGCCFDLELLSVFGVYTSFEKKGNHMISTTAITDCLLYSWSVDELSTMATHLAPAVGSYWRYFALCTLGLHFGSFNHPSQDLVCATGEHEREGVLAGERSRDFTDPLRGYESQRVTLRGLWAWLKRSFHPLPPPGLRHNSLPITGIMARNRLIALKSAQAAAAIFKTESLSGRSVEQSEEASAHGGRRAFELLTAMSSLRRINRTSLEEILEEVQSGHGDENGENGGDTAANAASTGGNHASSNHVSGKQQGNNGGSSEVPNGRGGGAAAAAGIV